MRNFLNVIRQKLIAGVIPEGKIGMTILGHRYYVGGMWNVIGKLQFDFLVQEGLKPEHGFLDVGCGSLRGGLYFIKYLDPGNYLGIDKEKKLIEIGIKKELGEVLLKEKKPEFLISDKFEFEKFSKKPIFSLALSLFTHLNAADIDLCLRNLRRFVDTGHIFYATFFEGYSNKNSVKSSSLDHFEYSKEELAELGEKNGWETIYLGNWNHPRFQMMMKYCAK